MNIGLPVQLIVDSGKDIRETDTTKVFNLKQILIQKFLEEVRGISI